MPDSVSITPDPENFGRAAPTAQASALQAARKALARINPIIISRIVSARFTGKGPFPVSEHKLGVRTGRLRASIRSTEPRIEGDAITFSIGSNVRYFAVHEFGASIRRVQLAGSVRLRTDAKGSILRRGNLATFAKATHKRVLNVPFPGGKRVQTDFPARAPLGTGIEENIPMWVSTLRTAWKQEVIAHFHRAYQEAGHA